MLRPGAAVLDLGCAAGGPVAAGLASRYRVTGLDISPEHIQQAARNVPGAEFVCADARTVTFPAGHFDAIISLYTFDHIPRDEHRAIGSVDEGWCRILSQSARRGRSPVVVMQQTSSPAASR
jgi:cyclopropane fatty-acyl-phospholipid synthase-like methyltransferase